MKRHHLAMKYSKLTYLSDKTRMPHKTEKPLYFNVLDAKQILSFSSLHNIANVAFFLTCSYLSDNERINKIFKYV